MKKTVEQIDARGKRVLVRLDLDVPIDSHGRISDDRRIRAAVPTVKLLAERGGQVILMAHMGRPKEAKDRQQLTLAPVAGRLSELAGKPVKFIPASIGPVVRDAVMSLRDGDILLLENLRFHEEEQIKDKNAAKDAAMRQRKEKFARELAELANVYVNDAFGTSHRDNASMLTVPQLMAGNPRVIGLHLKKELAFLGEAVANPRRPFVCLLGGAKVSDKLGVIRALLTKCDTVLIGGAMAYTFLAADGAPVGKSRVEPDLLDTARSLRREARERLRLPLDSVTATQIIESATTSICAGAIPDNQMGLDIGPATIRAYADIISMAQTVVWNGPMGVFETPPFDAGTMAMARALADATHRGAITIIGGGDSAAAVEKAGLSDRMTHISTGGGASLEFLEGRRFASLDVLDEI